MNRPHDKILLTPRPVAAPCDRRCKCGELIPIASWDYCSEYCRRLSAIPA